MWGSISNPARDIATAALPVSRWLARRLMEEHAACMAALAPASSQH
jgi:hypothetical protein